MLVSGAVVDISPLVAVDQGCGTKSNGIDVANSERIEVNILALWGDDDTEPVVLVSIDALYPGAAIRACVEAGALGLPPERLIVSATHTHAAPMLSSGKGTLGAPDSAHMARITSQIQEAVARVIDRGSARPARLEVAKSDVQLSINRRTRVRYWLSRKPRLSHVALAPNPSGERDDSLLLCKLRAEDGTILGYVWNYACHPVGHPDPERNSAHYPGVTRRMLRDRLDGVDLPVVFFQGFSGDTRPAASVADTTLLDKLRFGFLTSKFVSMPRPTYHLWTLSLATAVKSLIPQLTKSSEFLELKCARESLPGTQFTEGQTAPVTFQAIRLTEDFAIVAVSAEPVSEYAHIVRNAASGRFTMCVGCADDTYGYLPTDRMVSEGGYEGGDFCAFFGLGPIKPGVEVTARAALSSVINATA